MNDAHSPQPRPHNPRKMTTTQHTHSWHDELTEEQLAKYQLLDRILVIGNLVGTLCALGFAIYHFCLGDILLGMLWLTLTIAGIEKIRRDYESTKD